MDNIDWTNPDCQVTPNFSVHELIYLPQWKRLANEEDGLDDTIKSNLKALAASMESIHKFFGTIIRVHVTYRPTVYNALIGGAPSSSHIKGLAMDFDVYGLTCDKARQKILDNKILDAFDMYMEDLPGSSWVHLNLPDGHVRSSRFFKP